MTASASRDAGAQWSPRAAPILLVATIVAALVGARVFALVLTVVPMALAAALRGVMA